MNQYDKLNLNFLLKADAETLAEWYETMSEDDIAYASEILAQFSRELDTRAALIDESVITDVSDAALYLQKFNS